MHNPNEVLMGGSRSNEKSVSNIKGNIEAGIVIRKKSDGTPSLLKADGEIIGLSIGKDLSNAGHTAYARKGLEFPIKLTSAFVPVIGDPVHVSDTTGLAGEAGAGFTQVKAVYSSGKLVGKGEDGLDKDVALIDFPGGL